MPNRFIILDFPGKLKVISRVLITAKEKQQIKEGYVRTEGMSDWYDVKRTCLEIVGFEGGERGPGAKNVGHLWQLKRLKKGILS